MTKQQSKHLFKFHYLVINNSFHIFDEKEILRIGMQNIGGKLALFQSIFKGFHNKKC